MELLHVINAGVYRRPEKASRMVCPQKWICLNLSGLISFRHYYPDGHLIEFPENPKTPSLSLSMPGFFSDFEYGRNRENYVIMYRCPQITYQPQTHQIFLDAGNSLLPLAGHIIPREDEIPSLRTLFQRITEYHNSAIPHNQLSADILLTSLLQRFLQTPHPLDDDVERLRKNLEADVRWEHTLAEHCRMLGCGRDSLRREFFLRYKIAPGDYRIRMRLQKILHAFAYSDMNIKEIADSVGMKNVTHLNLMIRKHYGKTPSALCREYRRRQPDEI